MPNVLESLTNTSIFKHFAKMNYRGWLKLKFTTRITPNSQSLWGLLDFKYSFLWEGFLQKNVCASLNYLKGTVREYQQTQWD